jgi:hypothetical protein
MYFFTVQVMANKKQTPGKQLSYAEREQLRQQARESTPPAPQLATASEPGAPFAAGDTTDHQVEVPAKALEKLQEWIPERMSLLGDAVYDVFPTGFRLGWEGLMGEHMELKDQVNQMQVELEAFKGRVDDNPNLREQINHMEKITKVLRNRVQKERAHADNCTAALHLQERKYEVLVAAGMTLMQDAQGVTPALTAFNSSMAKFVQVLCPAQSEPVSESAPRGRVAIHRVRQVASSAAAAAAAAAAGSQQVKRPRLATAAAAPAPLEAAGPAAESAAEPVAEPVAEPLPAVAAVAEVGAIGAVSEENLLDFKSDEEHTSA